MSNATAMFNVLFNKQPVTEAPEVAAARKVYEARQEERRAAKNAARDRGFAVLGISHIDSGPNYKTIFLNHEGVDMHLTWEEVEAAGGYEDTYAPGIIEAWNHYEELKNA